MDIPGKLLSPDEIQITKLPVEELHECYATHGKPLGPLHVVPISVKVHTRMKKRCFNAGYIA